MMSTGIRRPLAVAVSLLVAALALVACGGDDRGDDADTQELPQGTEPVDLDPDDFTTEIDNPYWPMEPGSEWVYTETDEDGKHRIEVTVTDKTKQVANGVEARIVRDVVSQGGVPEEITDDWYAQDSEGTIWYLGEETTEYQNGKPANTHGSFEAGVDGAEAGIIMPANPEIGQDYRQEYYAGEAEDAGRVLSLDAQAEVPYGHFTDVLMTQDTNALEPKVLELKFYAKGVGPLLAMSVSGEAGDREQLLSYSPAK